MISFTYYYIIISNLLPHDFVIIKSLLLHYSKWQKQVIMTTYYEFLNVFIMALLYCYYPLLHFFLMFSSWSYCIAITHYFYLVVWGRNVSSATVLAALWQLETLASILNLCLCRFRFLWQPSQMRRGLPALLNATPSVRMPWGYPWGLPTWCGQRRRPRPQPWRRLPPRKARGGCAER